MTRILTVEGHRFFADALESPLGRCLSEERREPTESRVAITVVEEPLWVGSP